MQLQLNINDCKANILFGFLDIYDKSKLIRSHIKTKAYLYNSAILYYTFVNHNKR
jgi:hypothetical protein